MEKALQEKLELACWIAHKLFDRKMGPGTTGNLSFLHDDKIYITASGTCFGNLSPEDFACVDRKTLTCEGKKPSKELPLHQTVYDRQKDVQAVIHVHSTYAVLWSVLPCENPTDCVPSYTPYLEMTLGKVGMVPYAKPGSQALFEAFAACADSSDGWILKNHGPVVGGKDLMKAFACIEELEESCRIAWELRHEPNAVRIKEG
ncbi:MAG: class II aldolase/adducin family protein [Clostridia bacterium]|nr:class II aldolase/adducin family protein [Clostridia bacterium]